MTKAEVRIEILKLTHRHDQPTEMILNRSKELAIWVDEQAEPSVERSEPRPRGRPKKSENTESQGAD